MRSMKKTLCLLLALSLMLGLSSSALAATTSEEITQREKDNSDFSCYTATQGMVLLENNGVLPMAKNAKVALFGLGSRCTIRGITGSGAVNERDAVACYSLEEGLRKEGFTITTGDYLDAFGVITSTTVKDDLADIDAYITQAKNADSSYAVYVISRMSGEGSDRQMNTGAGQYTLKENERANLQKVAAAFDKTVVVLNVPGVIDTKFFKEISGLDAMLYMSLAGMRGGEAAAKILSGAENPSGKLTDTWAVNYEDYPSSAAWADNDGNSKHERYTEDIYVGYRYFDTFNVTPAYPFGYGLSYTSFSIETDQVFIRSGNAMLDVSVTNTGAVSGREVVQVYFSAPRGSLEKPKQELAAYAKTKELDPGETQSLTISFPLAEMSSYDVTEAAYVLEKGNYILRVGNSSRATSVAAVLMVDKTQSTELLSNQIPKDASLDRLSNKSAPLIVDPKEQTQINAAPHIAVGTLPTVNNASPYDNEKVTTYVYPGSTYTKATGTRYTRTVSNAPITSQLVFGNGVSPEVIEQIARPAGVTPGSYTLRDVAEGKITMTQLVADMSVRELCRLVVGGGGVAGENSALENIVKGGAGQTTLELYETRKIPNVQLVDGSQGIRITQHWEEDGVDYYQFATRFPCPTLVAMSWDTELFREYGRRIGQEMTEFGAALWMAPGLNIHRNPLQGRCGESCSEDPLIGGLCVANIVLGVQSWPGIGAALKSYACNNQETNRNIESNTVSEQALREIYLKGFEIAVKMAQPMGIMNSYNLINSMPTSDDYDLNTDILRGEWGFEGIVWSDWGGGQSTVSNQKHAGCDLTMAGGDTQLNTLLNAANPESSTHNLPLGDVQKAAIHILNVLMRTRQFEKLTTEYPGETIPAPAWSELFEDKLTSYSHVYSASVTEPTCTEAGFTTYTCTDCGDSFAADEVAALGHNFVEGVCSRCGAADPGYVTPGDRTKLNAAIEKAEALKEVDYTPETFSKVKETLTAAKALPADADQAAVDAAEAALTAVMNALEAADPFRFEDVKDESAFYFIPVYWAYNASPQITNGLDLIYFGPNNSCTRGQVVTFLWRAAGCPVPASTETGFADVKPGAFYEKAVAWAVEKGITNGMSPTSFAPDATCTRGQIVTFLWRFRGMPEPAGGENPFTDVTEGAFYYKAVLWAVEAHVTNGMSPTTFAPTATCTRGQIVTFLYRAMNG